VLRYIPLGLHADLPLDIRVFAQSSKHGVVPREPIVLLGDSYAQGSGEWLFEADSNRNGSFHSGHIIQELTGRDVITIGQAGAGSAEGLAERPARLPKPSQPTRPLRPRYAKRNGGAVVGEGAPARWQLKKAAN
jgi:hypothetical protein